MERKDRYPLKNLNTFGIDVAARHYVRFDAEKEIFEYLRRPPLAEATYLILGGGSNFLFTGDFPGTVFHPALKGISIVEEGASHLSVKAMAGEKWDELVAFAVNNRWGGIENLSYIPGTVGASVVQNIGAYGVEVRSVIQRVETIDVPTGKRAVFSGQECGFGYRTSRFKKEGCDRFLITAVVFLLRKNPRFVLDYPGVAEKVQALGDPCLKSVRRAIIDIRKQKLPDPAVIGNAGSFFKNPIVEKQKMERLVKNNPDLPHYPLSDGRFKLAAGWLIDRCGWKGKQVGRVAVHDRQALVLVNRGQATGREILSFSEKIRQSVEQKYGILLEREVRVVEPTM